MSNPDDKAIIGELLARTRRGEIEWSYSGRLLTGSGKAVHVYLQNEADCYVQVHDGRRWSARTIADKDAIAPLWVELAKTVATQTDADLADQDEAAHILRLLQSNTADGSPKEPLS